MALAPTLCQYTFSGLVVRLARGGAAETDTFLLSLSRREIGLSVRGRVAAITRDHPQPFLPF